MGSERGKKETLEFGYPLNFQQEKWLLAARNGEQPAIKTRTPSSPPSSDLHAQKTPSNRLTKAS